MTLRYFSAHVGREGLGNLQLLGRMAILGNVAEGTCPLVLVPGASPPPPPSVPVRDSKGALLEMARRELGAAEAAFAEAMERLDEGYYSARRDTEPAPPPETPE